MVDRPSTCICGCGTPLKQNRRGRPRLWASKAHSMRARRAAAISLPDGLTPLPDPGPLKARRGLDRIIFALANMRDSAAELRAGSNEVDEAIAWRTVELVDRFDAAYGELFGEAFDG